MSDYDVKQRRLRQLRAVTIALEAVRKKAHWYEARQHETPDDVTDAYFVLSDMHDALQRKALL